MNSRELLHDQIHTLESEISLYRRVMGEAIEMLNDYENQRPNNASHLLRTALNSGPHAAIEKASPNTTGNDT